MVIELGMGGPNKRNSLISLSHVVFFWSVQHTDCRSEDKTLRVNRDEEAEMSGNFEDNGLVKEMIGHWNVPEGRISLNVELDFYST